MHMGTLRSWYTVFEYVKIPIIVSLMDLIDKNQFKDLGRFVSQIIEKLRKWNIINPDCSLKCLKEFN